MGLFSWLFGSSSESSKADTIHMEDQTYCVNESTSSESSKAKTIHCSGCDMDIEFDSSTPEKYYDPLGAKLGGKTLKEIRFLISNGYYLCPNCGAWKTRR